MRGVPADRSIFTNSEFFIAKITFVCDKPTDEECDNYSCSWHQLEYCPNLKSFTDSNELIYGDCSEDYNVAYPIAGFRPEVNTIVLMRYRGTVDQTKNVFEFISYGGTNYELALTAIQCSGDILTATFSDGCRPQTE